jgi:hypothetical protein
VAESKSSYRYLIYLDCLPGLVPNGAVSDTTTDDGCSKAGTTHLPYNFNHCNLIIWAVDLVERGNPMDVKATAVAAQAVVTV